MPDIVYNVSKGELVSKNIPEGVFYVLAGGLVAIGGFVAASFLGGSVKSMGILEAGKRLASQGNKIFGGR